MIDESTIVFNMTEVLGSMWMTVLTNEMVQIGIMSFFFVVLLIGWIKGVEHYDAKKAGVTRTGSRSGKPKAGTKTKTRGKGKSKKPQYEDTSTTLMPTVPPAKK